MSPRMRLLVIGSAFLLFAVFGLLALVTAYWPFQAAVEVLAPFLVISILTSVGVTAILVSLLLPTMGQGRPGASESVSALDSLLSETGRRR